MECSKAKKADLEEVSCLLGQLGSNKCKVFLVEFALQMVGHLILIESAILAQRTYKLNPVKTYQIKKNIFICTAVI